MTGVSVGGASPVEVLTCDAEAVGAEGDAVIDILDRALAGRYRLEAGPRRVRSVTYLDTADWRLHRKGLVLAHDRGSGAGTLVARRGDTEATTEPAERPQWPALLDELPHGAVRDLVAGPLWIRAALPAMEARVVTRELVVRGGADEVVARLVWREITGRQPVRTGPFVRIEILPAGGPDSAGRLGKEAKRLGKALRNGSTDAGVRFRKAAADPHPELLAAAGLPDRPEPPLITADLPADVAVARALQAIAANVEGTVADTDTEYLHDLRVAVRRSRSLLKLGAEVLPERLTRRYARELAWLGQVTGPVRDLDVYLLGLDALARRLVAADPAELEPFERHLRARRDTARRALVRSLRTKRFAQLAERWPEELAGIADPAEPEATETAEAAETRTAETRTAVPTAAEFARRRLTRTAKRVTKLAAAITPDLPADDVHDLRKRCKELRYLLEFAEPLCVAGEHAAVLKRLKRLQDILGAFQDGEVQSLGLREQAEQLHASGSVPAGTLLAMGELAGTFALDQQRARHELTAALRRFLDEDLRRRIGALVA